jgi:hypothetical protein
LKNALLGLVIILGVFTEKAFGQNIPGLAASNYGGLYRAAYNPAVFGGPKHKWQINIGTLGGSINYRYFVFIGKNSLLYPLLAPHSTKELYGRSRTMGSLMDGDPLYLVSEIRWPSVSFSLGKYQGLALQFRTRGFVQGNNLPAAIRNLYFKRLDTESTPAMNDESWGDFDLVQQSFSEMSLSYGIQLVDLEAHKLRVGATVKRIFGARIGYLSGSAGKFSIRSAAGSPESSELVISDLAYETGYSAPTQKMAVGNLFDADKYGSGWGYDVGLSYEFGAFWTSNDEKFDESPAYLFRLGVSLTDIGSIRYGTARSRVIAGQQPESVIGQKELETIADKGPEGFMNLFPAETDAVFDGKTRLPQAIHLEADIQLLKGFFLNMAQTKRYRSDNRSLDIYQQQSFTITPRFENEDSDFAFPISFIKGNKRPSLGAVAHFGPLFIGFSNVNGLIKKTGARGSMVYLGFTAWKLNRRQHRDQ